MSSSTKTKQGPAKHVSHQMNEKDRANFLKAVSTPEMKEMWHRARSFSIWADPPDVGDRRGQDQPIGAFDERFSVGKSGSSSSTAPYRTTFGASCRANFDPLLSSSKLRVASIA